MSILMSFLLVSFKTTLILCLFLLLFSLLIFDFAIFSFWYSIKYLGNINWEVLLLDKLEKQHLPPTF